MTPAAPSLPDLFRLCAQHHGALTGFVRRRRADWADIRVRRTAREGLAVLAAMLRRLIWWLAREQILPPLRPREAAPPPVSGSRARHMPAFRLCEAPRERRAHAPNPCPTPDTDELSHALVLQRLETLAAAWRARHRLARLLARRLTRSDSKPALRRPALHHSAHARLPDGFRDMLDYLDEALTSPDTS
jgi:hypothetical protein